MVVRLHNISKWAPLKAGRLLELPGSQPRLIRLEVNCEAPARFDLVGADGKSVAFLAVVTGHEVIEFSAEATVRVGATSEGEVWFFTNDGEDVTVRTDGPTFTSVMARRARNPDLERVMRRAREREGRLLESMRREFDQREARLRADMAKAKSPPHDPATGEVIEDVKPAVPAKPAEPAERDDQKSSGGDGGGKSQEPPKPAAKGKAKGVPADA